MGAYWGLFYRPQAYQSVYIGFNTPSQKPLETNEKPRNFNEVPGPLAEGKGNAPQSHLTCTNAASQNYGGLMGPIYIPQQRACLALEIT